MHLASLQGFGQVHDLHVKVSLRRIADDSSREERRLSTPRFLTSQFIDQFVEAG